MTSGIHAQIPGRVKLAWATGLGGLLLILLGLGFYSAQMLRRARTAESESTRLYLARREALTVLGDSIYLAGSHVRDYLVDPDEQHYASHAALTAKTWSQVNGSLDRYRRAEPDSDALIRLTSELESFEQISKRALQSQGAQRRLHGYDQFAAEIGPARDGLLQTIEKLGQQDDASLRSSIAETAAYLAELEVRLIEAIGLSLALGIVVAGLAYRHLLRLESEAAVRYRQSVQATMELERLSHRLLAVQEEERKALARELHDGVGQALGAVLMDLGQARSSVNSNPSESLVRIKAATELAEAALHSVRDISLLLRPSMLDDLGLLPALHWQAREVTRRTGMLVTVHSDDEDLDLDEELRTTIFRVVQEALQNAARHSGATSTDVNINTNSRQLRLEVRDNGSGFDPAKTRGLGLLGMQERVMRYGGKMTIVSAPGQGTRLEIDLPIRTTSFGPQQHRHYENANFVGG